MCMTRKFSYFQNFKSNKNKQNEKDTDKIDYWSRSRVVNLKKNRTLQMVTKIGQNSVRYKLFILINDHLIEFAPFS